MFSWIKEFHKEDIFGNDDENAIPIHVPFNIEKLDAKDSIYNMTVFAQFLNASSVLLPGNTSVQLGIENEEIHNLILKELVPHYEKVKVVLIDNRINTIMMEQLKNDSVEIFRSMEQSGELSPLIMDFYRSSDRNLLGPHKKRRTCRYFNVLLDKLEPINLTGTDSLRKWIEDGYIQPNERLALSPTGWVLEDELQKSVALRFFASFCPSLLLVVDADDMKIVGLDILKNK
ncbi:hypothetical protein HQN89_28495 [Paenibacillus frigoriresistens]|uniref:hypothetical protein n=1 Tax=Paenibacillus alginolyticus TaxID=59839 RepID=UPI001567B7EF|nr:hypothetical protein [Paenibacillus frigoriresistens]NRF94834.1 hypothetical protein [Paenibacillus frigoriresistens]